MKKSEETILIFLDTADDRFKFARHMSNKLSIDYAYLLRILAGLRAKELVGCVRRENKVFYRLLSLGKDKVHKIKMSMI